MSGSTIGGVVGGAIGFWVGGPQGAQWGWMIGSAVGAYVDPEQVFGPRLQDASQQTSIPGVYITRGWGAIRTAGELIWQEPTVVEHTRTQRQGKGGPETVSYYYTRSHAIGICRGVAVGILIVKENGKIVLDQRTDAEIIAELNASGITGSDATSKLNQRRAQNAKFLENTTFYLGTPDQLPDPTIEEHLGVDETQAFPDLVYMVRTNPELVLQGAISQYEFVVVLAGESSEVSTDSLSEGRLSRFVNGNDPRADAESDYTYTGFWTDANGSGKPSPEYDSIDEVLDYYENTIGAAGGAGPNALGRPSHYVGWISTSSSFAGNYASSTDQTSAVASQPDPDDLETVLLIYQWVVPELGWSAAAPNTFCPVLSYGPWQGVGNGMVLRRVQSLSSNYLSIESCSFDGAGGWTEGIYPLCITVKRKRLAPESAGTPIPDAPGYVVTDDGQIVVGGEYTEVSGTYRVLSTPVVAGSDPNAHYSRYEVGPAVASTDPNYGLQAFWEAEYAAAVAAGTMPAGLSYPADYPQNVASVYQLATTPVTSVSRDSVVLGSIVADLCRDAGLGSGEYDVSQLTDLVPGFRIASEGGADAAISALQGVHLFDVVEYDGKVRFTPRGGTSVFAINDDDLVERDGDPFETETIQEYELPRSVTVGYSDPAAGYGPNTQKWERRTSLIDARGEISIELPVTISADTAATAAKRKGMIGWAEPDKHKFSLPSRLSWITPGDVGSYTKSDGEVISLRIMQAEDDSGIRYMESANNAAEAYAATATGVAPKPPTIVDVQVRGPTFAVYMNLPQLRTQDNTPGATIAACGLLPGWAGADIYLSVDGGVSYQPVTTFTTPSTMGRLTADCTDSSEPISVLMNSGSLQSVTLEQIALRQNAFAITTNDESEVGQFQTATAGGSGAYDLTDTTRGLLETDAAAHDSGDPFVMVSTAQFLPLDISLSGKTLYFKAVSLGTSIDSAEAVPFVFAPQFGSVPLTPYTDENGDAYTDESGIIYYGEVA